MKLGFSPSEEHRLVYQATEDSVLIASCRYHY
jgi:Txe/YoeB family toxin of Txe-Axe toxin-antitoxin module